MWRWQSFLFFLSSFCQQECGWNLISDTKWCPCYGKEYFCMSYVFATSYSPFSSVSCVHYPQEMPPAYTHPGMYFSWTSAFYLGSSHTFSSLIKCYLPLFLFSPFCFPYRFMLPTLIYFYFVRLCRQNWGAT